MLEKFEFLIGEVNEMKNTTNYYDGKYLKLLNKSGCVSADYFVTDDNEDSVVFLYEDIEKSGHFKYPNKPFNDF